MKKLVLILGVALSVLACNKTETSSKDFKTAYIDTAELIKKKKKFKDEDDKFKIKEADLKKHLEGELEKTKEVKKEEKAVVDENKKVITKEDVLGDNQLNTSIAILKSLIIMNK